MKLILTIIASIAFCITLPLAAQGKNRGAQTKGAQKPLLKPVAPPPLAEDVPKPVLPEPPMVVERYEIFTSFSQGKKLVGFTDPRYVANDKTDYLKSDAMTGNLEFTVKVPYQIKGNASDSTLAGNFPWYRIPAHRWPAHWLGNSQRAKRIDSQDRGTHQRASGECDA